MKRNAIEEGVTGRIDGATTYRDEPPLSRGFRTEAQLRGLRDAGIKTDSLSGMSKDATSGTTSSTKIEPR